MVMRRDTYATSEARAVSVSVTVSVSVSVFISVTVSVSVRLRPSPCNFGLSKASALGSICCCPPPHLSLQAFLFAISILFAPRSVSDLSSDGVCLEGAERQKIVFDSAVSRAVPGREQAALCAAVRQWKGHTHPVHLQMLTLLVQKQASLQHWVSAIPG